VRPARLPRWGILPVAQCALVALGRAVFWSLCAAVSFRGLCAAEPPAARQPQSANKPAAATGPATASKPASRPANRLANETSPYLLLHAHNPVDWYPWGDEAFAKAKREKKPIFLSIGYSSCYWCHVMERESFLNDEVARELNGHFVAIKVDREERPDIDEVYMRALQIYLRLAGTSGGGGWPLTMLLSPDGKPLVGGTYFPPHDRDGRTGLMTVLKKVHQRWSADPATWQKTADQLAEFVRESLATRPAVVPVKIDRHLVDAVQRGLAEQYDRQYGGFGFSATNSRQAKFPEPPNLVFLLDRWAHAHDQSARDMLLFTLDKMAEGGIRDHLGGGFHRYSTDRFWRVPHFEKMLYDNGQLASVYARAYELAPRPEYQHVVDELLEFVRRELTAEQGGFYSALDAETAGQEGAFYTWRRDEVAHLLSADEFALFAASYGLGGEPNFEGRYVLNLARPAAKPTSASASGDREQYAKLRAIDDKLLAVRGGRKRPLTDTKVLAGWNGLMIRGYADAGRVFGNPRHLVSAARAADFVLANMRTKQGRLLRSYREGQAKVPAFLDDYAFFIDGLLALHRADGDRRWVDAADLLMQDQLARFWDERGGGFYFSSADHEVLIARSKVPTDGATPSGNSVSAANLLELSRILDKADYLERARQTIASAAALVAESPTAAPQMAAALARFLDDTSPKEPPAAN
jgi:uncharacterized protein